jgi:phage terminase large subunit-like protein
MEPPLKRRNGASISSSMYAIHTVEASASTLGPGLVCMLHKWQIFAIVVIVGSISQSTFIRKLKKSISVHPKSSFDSFIVVAI